MFIREDEKIDEIGFGGLKLIQSSDFPQVEEEYLTLVRDQELFHLYFPIRCLKAS